MQNALLFFDGCDQQPFARYCDTITWNGSDGSFSKRSLISHADTRRHMANQHVRSVYSSCYSV